MTQYFFKLSLSLILLSSFAFAKSKLYILPQDAQQSQKKILQLIKKSKKNTCSCRQKNKKLFN